MKPPLFIIALLIFALALLGVRDYVRHKQGDGGEDRGGRGRSPSPENRMDRVQGCVVGADCAI